MMNERETDMRNLFQRVGREVSKAVGAAHAECSMCGNFGFFKLFFGCEPSKNLHVYAMPLENGFGLIALTAVIDKRCLYYLTEEEHSRAFAEGTKMYDCDNFWLCGNDITVLAEANIEKYLTSYCEKDIIFDGILAAKRKVVADIADYYGYVKKDGAQIGPLYICEQIAQLCKVVLQMDAVKIVEAPKDAFQDGTKSFLISLGKEENDNRIIKRLWFNVMELPETHHVVLCSVVNQRRKELPPHIEDVANMFS